VTAILKIENLVKDYGRIRAVNNLSLEVNEGAVFGLLGPNGSGKTTTLGVILDVIKKTSGSYKWFGFASNAQSRQKIGAILEVPAFYPYLSARRNLKIAAQIKGRGSENIERIVETVGLKDRIDDPYRTYSLGMKQRLAIGSALLSDPPVLILDEPTNGLDPQGIAEIRNVIKSVAAERKTILLASHILDEVQKVCTDFAVLKKGSMIYSGTVDEALNGNRIIELASGDNESLRHTLGDFGAVSKMETDRDMLLVQFKDGVGTVEVNRFLIDKGIVLSHLAIRKGSLEQKFLNILEESDAQNT
jgi:ABC-2 type transport system ATP-binding protein